MTLFFLCSVYTIGIATQAGEGGLHRCLVIIGGGHDGSKTPYP